MIQPGVKVVSMISGRNTTAYNVIDYAQVGHYTIELSTSDKSTNIFAVCVGQSHPADMFTSIRCIPNLTKRFNSRSEAEEYMSQLVETYTLVSM